MTSPGPVQAEAQVSAPPAQQAIAEAPVQREEKEEAAPTAAATTTATAGGESKKNLLPLIAGLIALLVIIVAAAVIVLGPKPEQDEKSEEEVAGVLSPEEREENAYRAKGWIAEGENVLARFYETEAIAERAAVTIRGSQNEAEMAAIYEEYEEQGHRTPPSVYSPVSLGDSDTGRGIFLMTYNRPEQFAIRSFFRPIPPMRVKHGLEDPDPFLTAEASLNNFVDKPLKILAFFKRTPEGLKLDWQTYAQTKYRLLDVFVSNPEAGKRGVFRVFVQEDVDLDQRDGEGASVFRMSDPANSTDYAKVLVQDDSELGRAFAPLKWRGRVVAKAPIKNATVSLYWSDEPEPKLQMGELICWEFLGLGGTRGNWKEPVGEQ